MPTKPIISSFKASGIDVLNAIRANASSTYQERIPVATQENIRQIGNAMMTYEATQNEFLSALVNRIGRVIITSKSYTNPLRVFKKGILEYLIYEEGKKEPTIFSYNSNKFSLSDYKPILKNIRSHIDERQGFEILNEQDRKNIDPFLVDVIGEKIGSNKNSDSLDKLIVGGLYNNDYIDVKYDMENLKKVKGLRNKMHLREIARGAEKQGFEVENFKDTLLRRIISKIKNRSYELETKEEPKRIADGNKEEKIILRPKTSKEKNNDLSMDNKIRPNMHLHGKLKDKISDYRNNWLLKRSETFKKKSEKYDDMHKKTQDKIFDIINKENKEQEQNQSMKFDKFGNRVTKTPEEIKAEKRAKDISEKALKSIHEQQREEVK